MLKSITYYFTFVIFEIPCNVIARNNLGKEKNPAKGNGQFAILTNCLM